MKKLIPLLMTAVLFLGCDKEHNPEGIGKVYVVNEKGVPIQNAWVHFTTPNNLPDDINVYKKTEIDGSAFTRWNYHVYVDVIANKGGYSGCTSIPIEPGKTTERTLTIYPFGSTNGCP